MKVAMITSWAQKCGIFSYSKDLGLALSKMGVEVYIVRVPLLGKKSIEIVENIVDRVPEGMDLLSVQHEYGLYQGFDVNFFSRLAGLGKPIVTTMHAVGNWSTDGFICNVSRTVIVHNKFCFDKLAGDTSRTVIIPHGATPNKTVEAGTAKRLHGIDPKIRTVGYVGYISPYKGLETLIESMTKVPALLVIAGGTHGSEEEETYFNELKIMSLKKLPNKVVWLGFVPDEELPSVYGAMDVIVYPSRYATESGALLMAMSYGKAIIASDIAPFREKSAFVTIFTSMEDLREKINMIINEPALRLKMENSSQEYVQQVQWYPNIAEKHLEVYRKVLHL